MKLLIVLLFFTVQLQDLYAQQNGCIKIFEKLDGDFFNALRKVESEGDICKLSADKLGPYQISEEYYNEAVEDNAELKTRGTFRKLTRLDLYRRS